MKYEHRQIEKKWQKYWNDNAVFKVEEVKTKPKYYALDMFPYPSGAGLHVGHPLGYIASDVIARYKRLKGFNVLHPMGYDSFGLPAEQYAIQTGQHPKITTDKNIARYRQQLDGLGFCFDWSREVRTSDPSYYKWTQWIFSELFHSWYNLSTDKAEAIDVLVERFKRNGSTEIEAFNELHSPFTAAQWDAFNQAEQEAILQNYRLSYRSETWVNWCEELGTVLANDEVKDGVSERGGHPVVRKKMMQWSMRITAYADRLLQGLDELDWSDALKEQQRNWIGKSQGAELGFKVCNSDKIIQVFTTRPDTIYGVSFMVLAPEHELVNEITDKEYQKEVAAFVKAISLKSERERQSNVGQAKGVFTGAYAIHPFTGAKIPIWLGEYVLAGYGFGAVMAVPAGDSRDYLFAKQYNIAIPEIFSDWDFSQGALEDKNAVLNHSASLSGLRASEAIPKIIQEIENKKIGRGQINYRLRDAVFSRQRYWGEPFPVYYENQLPKTFSLEMLPIELPKVDKYLPTEDGEPPLARAKKQDWKTSAGDRMEYNTMPGWAGSSWYFLRYMDPNNSTEFVSREKSDYWNQVDLYIGGSEHAVGHLLYARFWTKFLYDRAYIGFQEPFKKLINQGMILGRSNFVYRDKKSGQFVSFGKIKDFDCTRLNVDIHLVNNDILDIEGFKKWRPEFSKAKFVLEEGLYHCGFEVEKMSKSKYNVQTPDQLVEQYGADTLRLYEMFLGPLEQYKPWDIKGISGVSGFLKKLWRLFFDENGLIITEENPSKEALKTLHKTIKKITEDIDRYSFNTPVSAMMIAVNELTDQNCHSKPILRDMVVLLSPYAPHICDELWNLMGEKGSVMNAVWPSFNEQYLIERAFSYPVSFNGKMRFKIELPADLSKTEVEKMVLEAQEAKKWMEGKVPKKVIVVPGKIINIVI